MGRFLLIVLLAIGLHSPVYSQADSLDQTRWQLLKYDVGNTFLAVGHSYLRPFHWNGRQWQALGGVAAGTALLYAIDDETSRFISNQRESVPRAVRDYGTFYGSPENNFLLTTGVYVTGLALKNEKLRRTGVLLIASAAASGFLQQVVKSAVGRARPVAGLTKDTFDPFNSSRNFHSFPSGHAVLAFSNAYAIAKQFRNPWVKGAIYVVGLVPGVSRVWDRQHWLSDFGVSIALSIATVEAIDKFLDRKYDEKYNAQPKAISWNLVLGPGTLGVSMNF